MITPGPNNITGASMGISHGYRKSVRYVLGVGAGFFIIMVLSGLLSAFLQKYIPHFEQIVRVAGAIYILWMAYGILRSSFSADLAPQPALGFWRGLLLQFLNPKVMVMGLTLYASFLAPLAAQPAALAGSAAILGTLAFCFTSLWTLAGAVLTRSFKNAGLMRAVNAVLALLLVYTAIELSGVLALITAG